MHTESKSDQVSCCGDVMRSFWAYRNSELIVITTLRHFRDLLTFSNWCLFSSVFVYEASQCDSLVIELKVVGII